jgi:hypothetical protein
MFGRSDAHRASRLAAHLTQNGQFGLDVLEARPNGSVQTFASFRR